MVLTLTILKIMLDKLNAICYNVYNTKRKEDKKPMTDKRRLTIEKFFLKNCIQNTPEQWRDEDFEYYVEYMYRWAKATLQEWEYEDKFWN